MIGTINKATKVKWEKAFPGRLDWQCPECKEWNRYFEIECTYCIEKAETG